MQAHDSNEKKFGEKTCQTSHVAHPGCAPEGKTTAESGSRSSPLSIQPSPKDKTATLAGSSRVKGEESENSTPPYKCTFTLGQRGFGSSSRVGSVALLENTEVDEYYRNDSLKSVAGEGWSAFVQGEEREVIVWGVG